MTQIENTTYNIPVVLFATAQAKLDKLNRRAAKLGMPEVMMQVAQPEQVRCNSNDTGAYKSYNSFGQIIWVRDEIKATLIGDAPVINGYKFIATVDLRGENNIVRTVPGSDGHDFTPFYGTDSYCDHCDTARRRNDVYLLVEVATGKILQIGRNCAADFFRSKDAVSAIHVMEGMASIAQNSDESTTPIGERYIALERLMDVTAAVVREFGYVSRAMAEADMDAILTRHTVMEVLFPGQNSPEVVVTAADEQVSREVTAWFKSDFEGKAFEDRSDFERNVVAAVESGCVRAKNIGFLVWMVDGYARHMGRKAENAMRAKVEKASEFVGEVKGRISLDLTVLMARTFDGDYGPRAMLKLVDAAGNIFIWWGTSEFALSLKTDDKVSVNATVKSHDVYNGAKQTLLTRVTKVKD